VQTVGFIILYVQTAVLIIM